MNFNKITLAALMALLFAACSDDNKSVSAMGGAEEEQGVYALAGLVGAFECPHNTFLLC